MMETIAISKFKATCLAVLERVRRTGQPIRVTRRGLPVAEIKPPMTEVSEDDWLGCLADQGRIFGDLVEPVVAAEEWEALER